MEMTLYVVDVQIDIDVVVGVDVDGTATTTTASLTQFSSSKVDGTHNGDLTSLTTTTTTASRTSCQALTAITTTIIDGSDFSNDGISPLEMPSTLATTFPFTSPMKNAQKNNHNPDDGDGSCMSVCSPFSIGSTPFLSPPGQDIKRGRFTSTPIGNSQTSQSNCVLQFSDESSTSIFTEKRRNPATTSTTINQLQTNSTSTAAAAAAATASTAPFPLPSSSSLQSSSYASQQQQQQLQQKQQQQQQQQQQQ